MKIRYALAMLAAGFLSEPAFSQAEIENPEKQQVIAEIDTSKRKSHHQDLTSLDSGDRIWTPPALQPLFNCC